MLSFSFFKIVALVLHIFIVMQISHCDIFTPRTFFSLLTDCHSFGILFFILLVYIKLENLFFIRIFLWKFGIYIISWSNLINFIFWKSVGCYGKNVLIVSWGLRAILLILLIGVVFLYCSWGISISWSVRFTVDFLQKFIFYVLINILPFIFGHKFAFMINKLHILL